MSGGKPSYAAVAAKAPEGGHERADGPSRSSEPPPPYTITGQEAARHPAAQPHPCQQHVYHTQALTAPSPHGQLVQHPSTTNAHVHSHGSWTPAPNMSVARSRAQRRFWVAMIYAWLIYLLVGALIGGGISDMHNSPHGRTGHWNKHGEWRDDRFFSAWRRSAPGVDAHLGSS